MTTNLRDRAAQAAGKAPSTDVAPVAEKALNVHDWISQQMHVIEGALPSQMTPERLLRLVSVSVRQNPTLAECTPASLLGAIMTSTQLGLEPGPQGHCWLIPRRNKKNGNRLEVVWQLGYKGVIELASRSGRVTAPIARTVYEGDEFEWEYGINEKLRHVPSRENDRSKPIYWYAMSKDKVTGGTAFVVIDKRDVDHARKLSSAPNSPMWVDHYDQAGNKTAVMRLRHWLPQSPELAQAVALDDRVRHDIRKGVMDLGEHDVIDLGPEDYDVQEEQPETGAVPDAGAAASGDEAALVDDAQLRMLHTALTKAGKTKRDERLQYVRDVLGLPDLDSTKGLTVAQSIAVHERLEQDASGSAPSDEGEKPDTPPEQPALGDDAPEDERARLSAAIGKAADAQGLSIEDVQRRMQRDYRTDLDTADLADLSSLLDSLQQGGSGS